MSLKSKNGLLGVKWQTCKVSYQNEKSMPIIDFLPGFHWFPGQKMSRNQWKNHTSRNNLSSTRHTSRIHKEKFWPPRQKPSETIWLNKTQLPSRFAAPFWSWYTPQRRPPATSRSKLEIIGFAMILHQNDPNSEKLCYTFFWVEDNIGDGISILFTFLRFP